LKSHKTAKALAIITMSKPNESCYKPEGQAGAIEVTPAMIEAGVYTAREHALGEGLQALVEKVYIAMVIEAQTNASASATSDVK